MPATVVLGMQWGDEGKGKIVDILADKNDYIVRFNGGNNAGHTVKVEIRIPPVSDRWFQTRQSLTVTSHYAELLSNN